MADYNEAIKNLQTINGMPLTIRLAIEALEKQIPKKPILHQYYEYEEDGVQSDYSYYTCANRCHKYCQVSPQDGFCRKCGQAIDWSDER